MLSDLGWIRFWAGDLDGATKAAEALDEIRQDTGPFSLDVLMAVEAGKGERLDLEVAAPGAHGQRQSRRWRHWARGYVALNGGRAEDGLKEFREALRHRPALGELLVEDCLGRAYLELARWDEAIAEFERILKLNPRYPLAHYHLARAQEGKGERDRARNAYEEFLRVWKDADPDIAEVIDARRRLADLSFKSSG